MQKNLNRFLALLLCFCMLVGYIGPTNMFATNKKTEAPENKPSESVTENIKTDDSEAKLNRTFQVYDPYLKIAFIDNDGKETPYEITGKPESVPENAKYIKIYKPESPKEDYKKHYNYLRMTDYPTHQKPIDTKYYEFDKDYREGYELYELATSGTHNYCLVANEKKIQPIDYSNTVKPRTAFFSAASVRSASIESELPSRASIAYAVRGYCHGGSHDLGDGQGGAHGSLEYIEFDTLNDLASRIPGVEFNGEGGGHANCLCSSGSCSAGRYHKALVPVSAWGRLSWTYEGVDGNGTETWSFVFHPEGFYTYLPGQGEFSENDGNCHGQWCQEFGGRVRIPQPYPSPDVHSVTAEANWSTNEVVNVTAIKTNRMDEPVAGAQFKVLRDNKEVTTITTGSDGKASYAVPNAESGVKTSDTFKYVTNYYDLSPSDQSTYASYYKSYSAAQNAAQEQANSRAEKARQTALTTPHTYTLIEVGVPEGYNKDAPSVSKSGAGSQTYTYNFMNTQVPRPGKVSASATKSVDLPITINVVKYDKEHREPLEGFVFDVYENNVRLDSIVTDKDGKASYVVHHPITKTVEIEKKYIENYDYLNDHDKEVYSEANGYYKFKEDAQEAAQYEADQTALALATKESGKTREYKVVETSVGSNGDYLLDTDPIIQNGSMDETLTFTKLNIPIRGNITIKKEGPALDNVSDGSGNVYKVFNYKDVPFAGAKFELYAAEDIYMTQKTIAFREGEQIGTYVTGPDGTVIIKDLYIGKYKVVEILAPTNLTKPETTQENTHDVELKNAGETVPLVVESTKYHNDTPAVEVEIKKISGNDNSSLKGAEFIIYAAEDIVNVRGEVVMTANTPIEKIITNDDGVSNVTAKLPIGFKYVVKEVKAPTNYILNSDVSYTFEHSYKNDTTYTYYFDSTFANAPQMGKLEMIKKGNVLKDVTPGKAPNYATFNYGEDYLPGAVFEVYANKDIYQSQKNIKYHEGDLIGTYITGENGKVQTEDMYIGQYRIVEVKAPHGYTLPDNVADRTHIVDLNYKGQTVQSTFASTTFKDARPTSLITVAKKSAADDSMLEHAEFTLFADENIVNFKGEVILVKGSPIQTVWTNKEGVAHFSVDIPLDFKYHVEETLAPENYYKNDVNEEFTHAYDNDRKYEYLYNFEFKNEEVRGQVTLEKKDEELFNDSNDRAIDILGHQGDGTLEGAEYGIYAAEDILNPNGNGKVMHKKDSLVATQKTVEGGHLKFENLYLGKYYVKELTPSEGYLLDPTVYQVNIPYEGENVAIVDGKIEPAYVETTILTSLEHVKRQAFKIIKVSSNGENEEADRIGQAEFTVKLKDDVDLNGWDNAKTYDVMTTDEFGAAQSIELPYGVYIVKETKVPENLVQVEDFIVNIEEDSRKPQEYRVLNDSPFEAYVKIIKVDAETKKTVLLANSTFKIYDVENEQFITHKVGDKLIDTFVTDENGYVQTPLKLKYGKYQIKEIHAPFGYVLEDKPFDFEVGSKQVFRVDEQGDYVFDIKFVDQPAKGQIEVYKEGQVLTRFEADENNGFWKTEFIYEVKPLHGAVFDIIAAEDIYYPDNQGIIAHHQGDVVESITTDTTGKATSSKLHLGKYIVKEVQAPEGFTIPEDPADRVRTITLSYKDELTPVIFEKADKYFDERQVTKISMKKTDSESQYPLGEAVFELYAAEDIKNHYGEVIVEKDTPIETQKSGENGLIQFKGDIPLGLYYAKEIKAPVGFASLKQPIFIDVSAGPQDTPTIIFDKGVENKPIWVSLDKVDGYTNQSIANAELELYKLDKDMNRTGEVIFSWVSDANDPHSMLRLDCNSYYEIVEKNAPEGYYNGGKKLVFKPNDVETEQKLQLENQQVFGHVSVHKNGEQLVGVEKTENGLKFVYENLPLKDITFKLYAAEDIIQLDGVSEDWYEKDQLIEELVTDENGVATSKDLPLGKYYIKEVETKEGLVISNARTDFEIEYKGQDVPITITGLDLLNKKQNVHIKMFKSDIETGAAVPKAEFTLYNKEDIKNYKGKTIVKADTAIAVGYTNKDGDVDFGVDLPLGKYYIVETTPAPGFALNEGPNRYEIDAQYQGSDYEEVEVPIEATNKRIKHIFNKVDIESGARLDGAKLAVLHIEKDENGKLMKDEDGNYVTTVVDAWESDKTEEHEIDGVTYAGHLIDGKLIVGDTYIFREVLAPNGYKGYDVSSDATKEANKEDNTIKEEIMFVVTNDTTIIEHTMKDEVAEGEIIVKKTGEVLVDYKEPDFVTKVKAALTRVFEYITGAVQDAEFEIYANEDISHPDGVTGIIYHKGDLVGKVKTDYLGIGKYEHLPLGKYLVKEVVAGNGYTLNTEPQEVDLSYLGQDTPVVSGQIGFVNERQKVSIDLVKKSSAESENKYMNTNDEAIKEDVLLSGAVFGLYTKNDIVACIVNEDGSVTKTDKVLLAADTLVETATTDDEGHIHFESDLPLGEYYIKEITPPLGYHSSDEIIDIDVTYKGQDVEVIEIANDFYNAPVNIAANKVDITTGEPLAGATLAVYDEDGQVFETWVTDGTLHYLKHLEINKKYTLVELTPAEGYVTADPIEFTVSDRDEEGKIVELQSLNDMVDDLTKINISKTDITTGEEVPGAHLQIVNEEDKIVEEWVSTDKPHYIEKLPIGFYTLVETLAPTDLGYVKAEDVKFEVKDTGEIQQVEMKDDYTKIEISKTDITDGKYVPNATLSIIPLDEDGNAKEGEVFMTWLSEDGPQRIDYMPVGKFILREVVAPFDDGYTTAEDVVFEVKETGEIQKVEMKDDYTKIEISKTDITNGNELPGAELEIRDSDNNLVEKWTSSTEPHMIEKLPIGDYVLIETTAPDGYVTSEKIEFTVKDTGEIQKVEMVDDLTKIEISKTDITNGKELPGAKLEIRDSKNKVVKEWISTDKPYMIEMLPVGEYTLIETTAPNGYVTAEKVEFTVKDTGEIQKVEMKDDITKLEVLKIDAVTKKILPGAKLQILNTKGDVLYSWTSTDKPARIEKIPMGDYILKEVAAPKGYKLADDIKFTVKDTDQVQQITMADELDKVVPTGDYSANTNYAIILLGVGVVAALAYVAITKKKKINH